MPYQCTSSVAPWPPLCFQNMDYLYLCILHALFIPQESLSSVEQLLVSYTTLCCSTRTKLLPVPSAARHIPIHTWPAKDVSVLERLSRAPVLDAMIVQDASAGLSSP